VRISTECRSDWSILCSCSGLRNRGPQESAARHWNVLCWLAFTDFSAACCFHERIAVIRCSDFPQPFPFSCSHVCLVDKRTLADQPYCEPLVGHSSPTMGPSLPSYHPKSWWQAPRSCADPVFLCRRCDKIPPSKSCRRTPGTPPHICLFLSRGPPCLHFITSTTPSSS